MTTPDALTDRQLRRHTIRWLLSVDALTPAGHAELRTAIMEELADAAPADAPDDEADDAGSPDAVQGACPSCGASPLFIADAGYLTCFHVDCPDPDAAARLLELAAPPPGPVHPDDARHRRVALALTTEHYRRAREHIVASPEDHSAAMARVALQALADELLPTTGTPQDMSTGHADNHRPDTADTSPTRKDTIRTSISRAFDIPHEILYGTPDPDTPPDTPADMSAVRDLLDRWLAAGPPPLGTSINRWWDRRLAELAAAIARPSRTES